MSFEVSGEPIHTRCIAVTFAQGEPGSIEFRADLMDLRKGGLMALGDRITMAGIIHKMELHGAFSVETGAIERIEWDQSHVMHEPNHASKGECCRDPLGRLTGLIGVRLGEGFASTLKQTFGGPLGCTHISTLFQELSAFTARFRNMRAENADLRGSRQQGDRVAARSLYFDAALRTEGQTDTDISVRLADLFYAPQEPNGAEILFQHDEFRLLAHVDLAGWLLKAVHGKERSRRGPACEDSPWTVRDEALEGFAGQSLGGGMAKLCLTRFAESKEDARLLSAMLSLGPGMTQVGAAVSNTLAPSSTAAPPGSGLPGPGPCYLLRAGGPFMQSVFSGDGDGDEDQNAGRNDDSSASSA